MAFANTHIHFGVLAVSLGLALAGCSGMPNNPTLTSVHQPIVTRTAYNLDINADDSGVSISEQQRLADWFDAMGLGYGDRVTIEDPTMASATRNAIVQLASRHGILLSEGAPVSAGYLAPGLVRVVINRANAHVAGCPDWSTTAETNFGNGTSSGYGCATNTNLAAMVADKEDLIAGKAGTGSTVITTSTKAIASYRKQAPTGEAGLKDVSSKGDE